MHAPAYRSMHGLSPPTDMGVPKQPGKEGHAAALLPPEQLDTIVEASKKLARLGILSVFSAGNGCNVQLQNASTIAFGNRTGGLVPGYTNITNKAPDAWPPQQQWTGQRAIGKGATVPELEYIVPELLARNVSDNFGGVFLRDDTETEFNSVISAAA